MFMMIVLQFMILLFLLCIKFDFTRFSKIVVFLIQEQRLN